MYSCETEELQKGNTQSETLNYNRGVIESNIETIDSAIDIENRMQWVAYMTAQVVLRDQDARNQFIAELESSSSFNSFHIENLLGNNVLNQSFKNEFEIEFNYHYNYTPGQGSDPCDGIGRPQGRPTPTGAVGGVPVGTTPFDLYVSSLLNENCFEFYLPNYSSLAPIRDLRLDNVKSTAHPMTDRVDRNQGYNHFTACYVSTITIDDNTPGVVILVRPYRNSNNCTYSDYFFHFENFLGQGINFEVFD